MESNSFIAEVYRRMDSVPLNQKGENMALQHDIFTDNVHVENAVYHYKDILPKNKNARILDVGFGSGWFIAACIKLGYTNIYGMDFFAKEKMINIVKSEKSIQEVFNVEGNIGSFLSKHGKKYDFIHMSHVIEHVPKYSLLYVVDSIYASLNKNGVLLTRTPNMEGPLALSSLFCTLGHEYGFSSKNIRSLLSICGFENIEFYSFNINNPTFKQLIGNIFRSYFIFWERLKYRSFGATVEGCKGEFGTELIVTSMRVDSPELMNDKYS